MNNIQRMYVKTYKAMRRCVLADIDTYGCQDYLRMLRQHGRSEVIIEIRQDAKTRLKRINKLGKKLRYENLYEAARGERDWWNRR